MKTRPILFSAPMVRALLDGTKSQTRRALKPQPPLDVGSLSAEVIAPTIVDRHGNEDAGADVFGCTTDDGDWCLRCPYGEPGELLWVRETFTIKDKALDGLEYPPFYRSDVTDSHGLCFATDDGPRYVEQLKWTSSIHMPRWASRLTLRITDVRVQRLQEISQDDALAEGIDTEGDAYLEVERAISAGVCPHHVEVATYAWLWDSINGAGSWASNPWVWALTFDTIKANVDHVLAKEVA
jgi:hypothetical protein